MRSLRINAPEPRPGGQRRGVLLVVVLACVAIITLLTSTILQGTMQWRRQVRREAAQVQAGWLAESGIARGLWQFRQNQDFQGESWQPAADHLPGDTVVDIIVSRDQNQTFVRAVARLTEPGGHPVQVRRELAVSNSRD